MAAVLPPTGQHANAPGSTRHFFCPARLHFPQTAKKFYKPVPSMLEGRRFLCYDKDNQKLDHDEKEGGKGMLIASKQASKQASKA